MPSMAYTVGELKQRLATMKDELPVIVTVTGDDDYMKAYVTGVTYCHDNLPDGKGGDDIHRAGFVALLEADVEAGLDLPPKDAS